MNGSAGTTDAGCKGVRTSFNSSPIIPSCQYDSIDAIHNAFIMSRSSIRIGISESPGRNNTISHFFPLVISKR